MLLAQPSRSVAQPGSALRWGCRGRGFESHRSDHCSNWVGSIHRGVRGQTDFTVIRDWFEGVLLSRRLLD
jgi:hypothetical protein